MGLNDLMSEIKQDPASFTGDEAIENKVLKQVLALVEDKISEVKNQAVKWYVLFSPFPPPPKICSSTTASNILRCSPSSSLGQLIKIIRETQLEYTIEKLIEFSGGKDDELRDISGLGPFLTPPLLYSPLPRKQNLFDQPRQQRSRRLRQSCLLTVKSLQRLVRSCH